VNSERIYLDYAATTPMRSEVSKVIADTARCCGLNPSSLHFEGRLARAALDDARDRVANVIGARRTEIIFTSGGTEANNLALLGAAEAAAGRGHILASAIEHHAVLAALERLRERGYSIGLVPVDSAGRVDPQEFERRLTSDTFLASVMYANNEVGTVQPVAELAAIARRRGVLFHTDAVQAPTWLPLSAGELGADLLSISGHKFYGPKGVGVLYVRDGVPLTPTIVGGGQEGGRRSGTENVPSIVGLATALELAAAERPAAASLAAQLRDRLEAGICASVAGVRVNGAGAPRLPNQLNASFDGVEAAELLIAADLAGIAVSAGSACTSGSLEPSHVLAAMGQQRAGGGIRFSLGTRTTAGEIDRVVEVLPSLIARLRNRAVSAVTS
jgi:cysteine desulfurase